MIQQLYKTILIFTVIHGLSFSQTPTLTPEQTVNLPTGQMGFTLPLGTVQGVNGHDFPVQLHYKAGISLHQEASAAGLGYSYDAGAITRKIVYVPDDLTGSSFDVQDNQNCQLTGWRAWAKPLIMVLSGALMVISAGSSTPAFVCVMLTLPFTAINSMKAPVPSADSYGGGGSHTPDYNLNRTIV